MNLESLLTPFKWVDQEIQRPYIHMRNRLGNASYAVGLGLNALFFLRPGSIINPRIEGLLVAVDTALNYDGLRNGSVSTTTDGSKALSPYDLAIRFLETARLPVFLAGASVFANGFYQTATGYGSGDDSQLGQGVLDMGTGIGWLAEASSIYLRTSDPKLLDKEPLLKRAYNFVRKSLLPGLIPAPARA